MSLMEGPRLLSDLEDWRMSLMEGLRLFSDLEDWRMSLMEGPRLRSCGTPQVLTRSQCRCTDLNEHTVQYILLIMAIKQMPRKINELYYSKYSKANDTVINLILIDLGGKSLINSAGFEITPPHSWGKVVEKLLQFYCHCRSMWKNS